MSLPRASQPDQASFDLTPMIDVILLLIIFFMLSSQFAEVELRPVDLPREAGYDPADPSPAAVMIDVDRDGRLSVFGQPISLDELQTVMPAAGALDDPSAKVSLTIRADRTCAAGHLNRLAERLVSMGIGEWRLATTREGAPPSPTHPGAG